jgi:outer membrane protein assembly factor BamB
MKNKNLILRTWLLLVFVLFLVNITAASSIPKLINLEGKLMDSNGNALTGNYNMTFRIFNDSSPTTGTMLWEENHTGANNVSTSVGLFNVLLGSITTLDLNPSFKDVLKTHILQGHGYSPQQNINPQDIDLSNLL